MHMPTPTLACGCDSHLRLGAGHLPSNVLQFSKPKPLRWPQTSSRREVQPTAGWADRAIPTASGVEHREAIQNCHYKPTICSHASPIASTTLSTVRARQKRIALGQMRATPRHDARAWSGAILRRSPQHAPIGSAKRRISCSVGTAARRDAAADCCDAAAAEQPMWRPSLSRLSESTRFAEQPRTTTPPFALAEVVSVGQRCSSSRTIAEGRTRDRSSGPPSRGIACQMRGEAFERGGLLAA